MSSPTLNRRLPVYAQEEWRRRTIEPPAQRTRSPARPSLVPLQTSPRSTSRRTRATTFVEPGFSKERRLEPRSPSACSPTRPGFCSCSQPFEGNKGQNQDQCCRSIEAFMAAHRPPRRHRRRRRGHDLPTRNMKAIEAAELSFILGVKTPRRPLRHRRLAAPRHPGRGGPRRARLHPGPRPAGPKTSAAEPGRSTTSTPPTGPGGRCTGSMSRSPRRPGPSQASRRSSATGSSPWTVRSRAWTANSRPKKPSQPGRDQGLRGPRAWPPPRTGNRWPRRLRRSAHTTSSGASRRASACGRRDLRARPVYRRQTPTRGSTPACPSVFAALAVTRCIEARTGWLPFRIRPHRPPLPHDPDPPPTCTPSPPRTRSRQACRDALDLVE